MAWTSAPVLQHGTVFSGLQSLPLFRLPLLPAAQRKFTYDGAMLDFMLSRFECGPGDLDSLLAVEQRQQAQAAQVTRLLHGPCCLWGVAVAAAWLCAWACLRAGWRADEGDAVTCFLYDSLLQSLLSLCRRGQAVMRTRTYQECPARPGCVWCAACRLQTPTHPVSRPV